MKSSSKDTGDVESSLDDVGIRGGSPNAVSTSIEEGSRTVSGEGHLNGKNPPLKEASMRIRLLIYTNTPIQINS
jgi:hypothetical protein